MDMFVIYAYISMEYLEFNVLFVIAYNITFVSDA